MYIVSDNDIRRVAGVIHRNRQIIDLLELRDPQYVAVKRIVEHVGLKIASAVIIANALVAYQLTSRGEDYWLGFADWVIRRNVNAENVVELHRRFLEETRYNRFNVKAKIKRIYLFYKSNLFHELLDDPLRYCYGLDGLVKEVSRVLGVSPESKTIVFAGKMYYYFCKASGKKCTGNIPIPVDRRVAFLSLTSCMIRGCSKDLILCTRELMSKYNRRIVIDVWNKVSLITGIQSYRLDSLVWLLGRYLYPPRRPIDTEKIICEIQKQFELQECYDDLHEILEVFMQCYDNEFLRVP